MSELVPYRDMRLMAETVAKSGLFGIKQPEQALALMIVAQSEGRHPGVVARDYHIIQGRPALKADTMLARFQECGGKVQWHELSDKKADATFSHPSGGELRMSWTIEDAKRAGLNSQTWKQYPRAMLRARLISEAIRTIYPAVIIGTYTPEEIDDMPPQQPRERDMGAAQVVESTADATALIADSGLDPADVEAEIKRRKGASAPESINFSALSAKQYGFVQTVIHSMCEQRRSRDNALAEAKQWAAENYAMDFTKPDWAHIASVMTDVYESAKERGSAAAQAGHDEEREKAKQLYQRADLLLKEASAHID